MKQKLLNFAVLALLSGFALAASVPNTFTASTPAVAAEVNANFAALVTAVTALETRVAALENTTLTAADVAGTYKVLSIQSTTGSLNATKKFESGSSAGDGTMTFNANGTFDAVVNNRSNAFSGKAQDCAPAPNSTGSSAPGTDGNGAGQHAHSVVASLCDQNAAVFTSTAEDNLDENFSGTWALDPATNTITVTPDGDEALTVYASKAGGAGYSVEVRTHNNPDTPGREFSLNIFVKQP